MAKRRNYAHRERLRAARGWAKTSAPIALELHVDGGYADAALETVPPPRKPWAQAIPDARGYEGLNVVRDVGR